MCPWRRRRTRESKMVTNTISFPFLKTYLKTWTWNYGRGTNNTPLLCLPATRQHSSHLSSLQPTTTIQPSFLCLTPKHLPISLSLLPSVKTSIFTSGSFPVPSLFTKSTTEGHVKVTGRISWQWWRHRGVTRLRRSVWSHLHDHHYQKPNGETV
jgi:hypothetical protein